ncbi:SctD/MshK family protein [Chelativorans sp. YIM 93263]|uniref:SctD/MshK family protein n=1 Tax=Chelativorans sp. YIM 93263 TaxID=2906648 RepID=UPI002378391F|nr:EscD/YscD/HrpQ family type III secretion system periplasmic domain-containing protein [Chelativorans sp. YIM 93263]
MTKFVDRVRDTALVLRISHNIPGLEMDADRVQSGEPYIDFEVTGGLHSGARLDFGETTFTVGSSVEADVVLSDPEIADIHVRLRIVDDRVDLEALGGAVRIIDGDTVPEGYGRRCRLPLEISLGGANLRLLDTRPPRPAKLPFSNRSFMIAVGLAAAIFAVPVASNTLSPGNAEDSDSAHVNLARADASGGATSQEQPAPEQQALGALQSQMKQAGLSGLSLTAEKGRIVVSGSVPDHRAEAWRSVQAWFDEVHGGRLLLMSNVVIGNASEVPRLPLRAIWYGERPYIITAGGARYHEGAFVDGGWIIKEIGEERLLLAKGGTEMAIEYR